MIEIHLLEQLSAFAEWGTLSAAAEKLHTSQPALTRSMKKLEEELGTTLFARSKNRLALNETGLFAAQCAERVLNEHIEFERRIKAFDRSLHTLSVGFCAPVPQTVLMPLLNSLFTGMTISADMEDDENFLAKLEQGTYQLAVTHEQPTGDMYHWKKCGHEDLFMALTPGNPLAFCPELHLSDLDGMSVLLLTQIGFWANINKDKTPNTKYLLQIEPDSFWELASHSDYPVFASSWHIRRGETLSGKVNIPLADPECHTDYYLVCLASEKDRFCQLFDNVTENTIQ
ncbi:MAG: LysR family transcriptional regulator [Selenomonadaceae bacterium]|nr:LysR family transcriptional regulator [Selenomonadaceae bacterium]